ncbi:N-acetyl-gamma-glutamyl-phosphate reductase [uncultured Clostridium sp.]|uniref:N-acetyl-gamma-glutamyl-phosphate reductase n=1 Tax=uncultured Clostridium sp. TaxID=59620 RepID=UPI002605979F|nr:N-acetyl-gamma-glutamyl-phosphate reductase [uncultured Clostridium sp.]
MKIKVGIIGATGFVGSELIRLLLNHNNVEISAISSKSFLDEEIANIYKNFINISDLILEDEDSVIEKSDVIFTAVPHGLSEIIASKILSKNKILIDLGADFRLSDEDDYLKFYNKKYLNKDIHKEAIYCIPELHRRKINKQSIIGNPGCYPTSISLGLAPALYNDIVKKDSIIIDAKSGVTGAGRGANDGTHYISCNENFKPYGVGGVHRHIPEIEEVINSISKVKHKISFTPHLIPINRGILSTIYFDLDKDITVSDLHKLYVDFYKEEKFVVVVDLDTTAEIKNIKSSNYCHISIHKDERCNRAIIISTIDNMIKGAAGQAIQNMNIRMGFNESEGLNLIPSNF